jgi:hypothetical protein
MNNELWFGTLIVAGGLLALSLVVIAVLREPRLFEKSELMHGNHRGSN